MVFVYQNPEENPCDFCGNLKKPYHEVKKRNSSCVSCEILFRGAEKSSHVPVWGDDYIQYEAVPGTALSVALTINTDQSASVNWFKLYTLPGTRCPWNTIGYARGSPVKALDMDQCVEQIKNWMDNCQKNHPECSNKQTLLPTRVVYVGESDGDLPALYISNGKVAEYAALSHCWGEGCHLKTTRESLDEHISGMGWNLLSQTFKDAILTTRLLGLRYLWIDSLCILQGDPGDWELESKNMADIYANAQVVLGATYSPDGSKGLFTREHNELSSPILSGYNEDNSIYEIYCRRNWTHYYLDGERPSWQPYYGDGGEERQDRAPLLSRGWAFQERLLASRYIHFTAEELVWECRTSATCECKYLDQLQAALGQDDDEDTVRTASRREKMGFHNSKTNFDRILLSSNLTNMSRQWLEMVQVYSRKDFKYRTDLLPALSGLSKLMQRQGAGKYLAGLWEEDLIYGILWMIGRDPEKKFPPFPVRESLLSQNLPSWSWISVATLDSSPNKIPYGVSWPFLADKKIRKETWRQRAFFINAACTTEGKDSTGATKHGHLTLKGRILLSQSSLLTYSRYIDSKTDYDNLWEEEHLYCVLLLERTDSNEGENDEWDPYHTKYWLMLKKLDTSPTTYKRVGVLISRPNIRQSFYYEKGKKGHEEYEKDKTVSYKKARDLVEGIQETFVTIA